MSNGEIFQIGDKVRCVDAHGLSSLTEGQTYTVNMAGTQIIGIEGLPSLQYAWRFAKVSEPR